MRNDTHAEVIVRARPAIVDAVGNINVHTLEDLYIPVLPPAGGDLSARVLTFDFVSLGKSFPLIAHPTNPAAKVISISATSLRSIPNNTPFALIDRTANARVKWFGMIRKFQ